MEGSACDAIVDVDALGNRLGAQARIVYAGKKVTDSGFYICNKRVASDSVTQLNSALAGRETEALFK